MGLFYKRELPGSSLSYSTGLQTTKLVVGLGNIGQEFELTRHNAGFMAVDAFVKLKEAKWEHKKALQAFVADLRDGNTRILVIKPTTMMNLSGEAVRAVQSYFKVKNADMLVIYDELDLPFGTLKIGKGGGSAGHNGIKSLIEHVGEDFSRIRIGIGPKTPKQMDTADFVLQKFSEKQQKELSLLSQEAASIISEFLAAGSLQAETRKVIL